MLLQERIKHIQNLERQVGVIKKLVEEYLANTNETLDERWSLYQKLPSFLRNHSNVCQDFLFDSEGYIINSMFVDGGISRYELVDVYSFLYDSFGNLQNTIIEYNADNPDSQIDISATKEYILKHNLGSFENDW